VPELLQASPHSHDPPAAEETRVRHFTRADLERGPREVLSRGRWANAVLYRFEHEGVNWVVKDFRPRGALVRMLIGRFLIGREFRALRRLVGIPATPQGAFRIDAYALAYRYVPGRSLRGTRNVVLDPGFFAALERGLAAMHSRANLAHFDLRNARNILMTDAGEPLLIDFQSAVETGWMPGPLRRFAQRVDLAAIYKHWRKRSPDTLGEERLATLARMNRIRPLWALRGYVGAPQPPERKRGR
jgi:predicted Ser/Thr protein kinase